MEQLAFMFAIQFFRTYSPINEMVAFYKIKVLQFGIPQSNQGPCMMLPLKTRHVRLAIIKSWKIREVFDMNFPPFLKCFGKYADQSRK
ncbi:hypothetical protein VNO77_43036 [Canavalia gladiata]|uniref:Uncharacterized protein n=1 Tax=Canavalia gladiata TaxID=3824 RepID=A0AAN9PP05_CANGL